MPTPLDGILSLSDEDLRKLIVENERTIAEQREILSQQKDGLQTLRGSAERAGQINNIWKLVTSVLALVIGGGAAVLYFGGEFDAWSKIKAAHFSGDETSTVYNHKLLRDRWDKGNEFVSPEDLAKHLGDSQYVTLANLNDAVDVKLENRVSFDQPIKIVHMYSDERDSDIPMHKYLGQYDLKDFDSIQLLQDNNEDRFLWKIEKDGR
jgi:hypothetical protein